MEKDDSLRSDKLGQSTSSERGNNKNNLLTKALRDNLKKRKLQASSRKKIKKILDGSGLIKE